MTKCAYKAWHRVINWITFEWILRRDYLSNGGSVIALRSILISLLVFTFTCLLISLKDPGRYYQMPLKGLAPMIIAKLSWYGVIFGSVYVALYARFASQWTYLANLYNQIKQAETNDQTNKAGLADWKAGFMEDADVLHLSSKALFASVIRQWGKDKMVRRSFVKYTPGGKKRYKRLMRRVNIVFDRETRNA